MDTKHKRIALRPSRPALRLARPEGLKAAATAVALNGDVVRLLVDEKVASDVFATFVQPGGDRLPRTHTEDAYSSILTVNGSSGSREIHLSKLTTTFPMLEILPTGEILVVGNRCWRYTDGSHEMNAKLYDPAGKPIREFSLGDGINHVQADAQGNLWVGYFDEGVYGNFGWQFGDGPIGAAGLSCFNLTGRKLWDFKSPEGFGPIDDCYALNVSGAGVWAYYYSELAFAFIDSNWRVRCWKTPRSGGDAFAVGHDRALLYQRTAGSSACTLFHLAEKDAVRAGDVELSLPTGVDLIKATIIGRGKELHVVADDTWFVFSLDALS
jgi:hypothetical protein